MTHKDVLATYQWWARNFEDCIIAVCALSLGCDCIVTRNAKDYQDFGI